ncbi:hypothetical protein D9757_005352 [Collybiopsis confluens]|uniref:Mitochondrial carrier protein n=1 Tax=Collybiopsis confluens TaxID=2823264 RepID=A0A8H5HLT1_9AGAR|nr:hypothetical protein D9757_005352 [Collybiopsis confluens]
MASSSAEDSNRIRLVGALAGMGSGLTKVTVGHGFNQLKGISFDTIKTRLQCSPGAYRGAFDALFTIVRKEGPLALYKGATPPAVGWAAIDAVLMGSLHNYRLFLIRNGLTEPNPGSGSGIPRLTMFGHGLAGFAAGGGTVFLYLTFRPTIILFFQASQGIAVLCLYQAHALSQLQWISALVATPIEHVKGTFLHRSIADRQFKGSIDCIRQIWRVQGPMGLYSGFTGSVFFRGNFFFMFLSFEMGTGTATFLSGGLGSFVFWACAIPADNIKNRMMSHPHPLPYSLETASVGLRPSLVGTAKTIFSQHGWRGFFRGLGPSFVRAFPVNAAAIFVYEGILRGLGAEKVSSGKCFILAL